MHGFPVGWDLISLWNHLGWNDKFFALYLASVVGFSFFRSVRLALRLWFNSSKRRGSSDQANVPAADMLATSALAKNLARAKSLTNGEPEELRQIVDDARSRFDYLWALSATKVALMKHLSILTLILSAITLSYDLMNSIGIWPIRSCGDCAGGPAEMLVPFVLGLSVSAALYALSTLFAGALARRKPQTPAPGFFCNQTVFDNRHRQSLPRQRSPRS